MRRFILLFFIFLSFLALPLRAQNFRLNAGGAYSYFNNINERQVSFYGYGINYSYYFYKRAGIFISFDHYLPVTYYGLIPLDIYDEEAKIPVYINGGANAKSFGFRFKIADPGSQKIEVNATLALSSFVHKGSYHIEESLRNDIENRVKSVNTAIEVILKRIKIPIAISCGYNFVLGQKDYISNWDLFSVPFSSSLVVRAGISLPIMRGPVPAQIKQITY
jgi:hypothetical protein